MAAELRAIGVGLSAGAVKPWARAAAKATMRANLRILFVGKRLLKTPRVGVGDEASKAKMSRIPAFEFFL